MSPSRFIAWASDKQMASVVHASAGMASCSFSWIFYGHLVVVILRLVFMVILLSYKWRFLLEISEK